MPDDQHLDTGLGNDRGDHAQLSLGVDVAEQRRRPADPVRRERAEATSRRTWSPSAAAAPMASSSASRGIRRHRAPAAVEELVGQLGDVARPERQTQVTRTELAGQERDQLMPVGKPHDSLPGRRVEHGIDEQLAGDAGRGDSPAA